jgi:hypothetical protein
VKGTYRFYQNGELVGESENIITDAGKTAILRYLAGYSGHFGRSIRLGIGSTAAAAGNTALEFEVLAVPVYLITPDYTNTLLVFKGRLEDATQAVIYEAGLSTSVPDLSNFLGSRQILGFDSSFDNFTVGTWNTTGPRWGADNLRVTANTSTTATAVQSDVQVDLSGYSDLDVFKVAASANNANAASIFVRFYTDASNYYTATINTPGSGFKVSSVTKGSFVATGVPSWANITQVAVGATANATGQVIVDFEGVRIEDVDTFTESDILVSRTVLGTQITKSAGVPLDIEYTLDLTL